MKLGGGDTQGHKGTFVYLQQTHFVPLEFQRCHLRIIIIKQYNIYRERMIIKFKLGRLNEIY